MPAHRLISQSPASPQVRAGADFVQPLLAQAQSSSLTVNNYFGILQGVIHGLGIGSLPDYLTVDFPDLVNILPGEQSAPIPTYLAYVEELRHSKRVECVPRLHHRGDQRLQAAAALGSRGRRGSHAVTP